MERIDLLQYYVLKPITLIREDNTPIDLDENDRIFIIGDDMVVTPDTTPDHVEQFTLLSISRKFIEINPILFQQSNI